MAYFPWAEFLQFAFVLSAFLYFLLPGVVLLRMGWDYLGGGAEFEKIHIATYLLILEFSVILLVDGRFRDRVISLCYREPTLISFVFVAAAVALFAIIEKKVSTAPFVDTFVAAVVVLVASIALSPRCLRFFERLIDVYFIGSIAIIFYEYYTKSSVIDPSYSPGFGALYRASALFEGPLSAASLLGIYSIVLWITTPISFSLTCLSRLFLSLASLAAVLATGGRTALLAALFLQAAFLCLSVSNQLRRGYFNKAGLIYAMAAIPVIIVALAALASLGLFDTMLARFDNDIGSALSRELALQMLSNQTGSDFWFGLSANGVLNLTAIQKEFGLIAIEISWVNFILVCGWLFTVPLFIAYVLLLFRFLPKYCGFSVIFPSFFLLVVTAASNGIWTKTTILTMSFAIVVTHMRKMNPARATQ